MEDFKFAKILEFEDKEYMGKKCDTETLIKLTNEINDCFSNEQNNFVKLCYLLSELKNLFYSNKSYIHGFHTKDKRYTFKRYCLEVIGLTENYVNRCIKCYEKFMFIEKSCGAAQFVIVSIKNKFVNFSKTKLFELLSVSNDQLDKDITSGVLHSDMSVREIREYVKSLKGKKKNNKVLEDNTEEEKLDELESSFDIQKEYTFDYFKECSKNQLIDIAFKCYQKYKELQKSGVKVTKTKKGSNN